MPRQREPWLDLLRAAAILLVLLCHGSAYCTAAWDLSRFRITTASLGVDLFFVLSGYLVGGLLYDALRADPKVGSWLPRFWARRWLRTLPNYYAFLVLTLPLSVMAGIEVPNLTPYLVFAQNLLWPMPAYYHLSWSLAAEEIFYLAFPLVLLAASRCRASPHRLFLVCGACIFLISVALRTAAVIGFDPSFDAGIRKVAALRLDTIMVGAFACYADRRWNLAGRTALLWSGAGITALAAALLWQPPEALNAGLFARTVLFDLEAAGLGLLLLGGLRRGLVPRWLEAPSEAMARWSYSAYLLNTTIGLAIYVALPRAWQLAHPVLLCGVWAVATLVTSAAVYSWFERPILRWRDRVFAEGTADWTGSPKGVLPASA